MADDVLRAINTGNPVIKNGCGIVLVPGRASLRINMGDCNVSLFNSKNVDAEASYLVDRLDDLNYYGGSLPGSDCTVITNVFYNGSQYVVEYTWTPLVPPAPNVVVQRSANGVDNWLDAAYAFNNGSVTPISLPGSIGAIWYLRVAQSDINDVPICYGAVFGPYTKPN